MQYYNWKLIKKILLTKTVTDTVGDKGTLNDYKLVLF